MLQVSTLWKFRIFGMACEMKEYTYKKNDTCRFCKHHPSSHGMFRKEMGDFLSPDIIIIENRPCVVLINIEKEVICGCKQFLSQDNLKYLEMKAAGEI